MAEEMADDILKAMEFCEREGKWVELLLFF
jgi:hypothetical protein